MNSNYIFISIITSVIIHAFFVFYAIDNPITIEDTKLNKIQEQQNYSHTKDHTSTSKELDIEIVDNDSLYSNLDIVSNDFIANPSVAINNQVDSFLKSNLDVKYSDDLHNIKSPKLSIDSKNDLNSLNDFKFDIQHNIPSLDDNNLSIDNNSFDVGEDNAIKFSFKDKKDDIIIDPIAIDLPKIIYKEDLNVSAIKPQVLDNDLNVKSYYFDDEAQHRRYIRFDISMKHKVERLRPLAKEVIYFIDCSASIDDEMLASFKKSVLQSLRYLSVYDKFNVISFNDASNACFEKTVNVNSKNLYKVKKFLSNLKSKGKTDIFEAISPYINEYSTSQVNHMVYLLTDGNNTSVTSLKDNEIIDRLSSLNKGNINIFSFSVGKSVNKYLLDLVSYANKGSSVYSTIDKTTADFNKLCFNTSKILVQDMDYFINVKNSEIYPKKLSNLYENNILQVYVSVPLNVDDFAISLRGLSKNSIEELLYKFTQKESIKSDNKIAYNWARQKFFDLSLKYNTNKSEKLLLEMNELRSLFDLKDIPLLNTTKLN